MNIDSGCEEDQGPALMCSSPLSRSSQVSENMSNRGILGANDHFNAESIKIGGERNSSQQDLLEVNALDSGGKNDGAAGIPDEI